MTENVLTEIPGLNLFGEDIEKEYKRRVLQIPGQLKMYNIDGQTKPDMLQKIKGWLFSALWNFPILKIDHGNIKPDHKTVNLHPDLAHKIIAPQESSYEFSPKKVTRIIYEIPTSGNMGALKFTEGGKGVKLYGLLADQKIIMHLYTDKELNEEVGNKIKTLRDKQLEAIENALKNNEVYLEAKGKEFQKVISDVVDAEYQACVNKDKLNGFL